MEAFELNAEKRTTTGSAEGRRLRKQGRVPAIVYGGNDVPVMVSLEHNELGHHLDNEAFFSHVIKLKIDGGKGQDVVLRDLQRHPARPFIEHADFMRVIANEALRMSVPLHFAGEEECPGVKTEEGIMQRILTEVEVECLPRDLPSHIEVDVSGLHVNESVHLSQLVLPQGVELVDLLNAEEDAAEIMVVSVTLPRVAVEEDDEAEEGEVAAADEADAQADDVSGEEEE